MDYKELYLGALEKLREIVDSDPKDAGGLLRFRARESIHSLKQVEAQMLEESEDEIVG